jgi:hypothetical protein
MHAGSPSNVLRGSLARTDCNCLNVRAQAAKWPFTRSDRIRLEHQQRSKSVIDALTPAR